MIQGETVTGSELEVAVARSRSSCSMVTIAVTGPGPLCLVTTASLPRPSPMLNAAIPHPVFRPVERVEFRIVTTQQVSSPAE